MCPIAREKRLKRKKDHWLKTLRTKYPYGFNDRARYEDTNKPVGLQLSSISRGAARTAPPRPKSVPTADTADVTFEQIQQIIHNDIKNTYFHIHVILNIVEKKMLKQVADQVLYRNNNPSHLQHNLNQYYI